MVLYDETLAKPEEILFKLAQFLISSDEIVTKAKQEINDKTIYIKCFRLLKGGLDWFLYSSMPMNMRREVDALLERRYPDLWMKYFSQFAEKPL